MENWFWPELVEDVRKWCRNCSRCVEEAGRTCVQAWTRTTLYSRPFRALQFDTVKVPECRGFHYLLTVICLFSRWCWIIPITSKSSNEIAGALVKEVFGPFKIFPVVLRSDNAAEFIGKVVKSLNAMLEIKRITGSAYHPQSQGQVESMHRTMN